MKKVITVLLIAAIAATGAMGLTACTKHNTPAESAVITQSDDKSVKKSADSDKEKSAQTATQAATEKAAEKPAQAPTQKATQQPMQAPTQKATQQPTQAPTQKSTQQPTQAPTQKATLTPTDVPTVAPTVTPTEAPTAEPATNPAVTPTDATTVEATEIPTEFATETALHAALQDVIKNSGATGYKVGKVNGSDAKILILSYGKYEAEKYYKIYKIGAADVTLLGTLSGSHTTAYTDKVKDNLCLYTSHMGSYAYGPIKIENDKVAISYDASGNVEAGSKTPAIPGTKVNFLSITDFSDISEF